MPRPPTEANRTLSCTLARSTTSWASADNAGRGEVAGEAAAATEDAGLDACYDYVEFQNAEVRVIFEERMQQGRVASLGVVVSYPFTWSASSSYLRC